MGMLDKVVTGKVKRPYLALVYGPDGVGKTTFAADAPKPIFLGKEDGSANMDVARLPEPKQFNDIIAAIDELISVNHKYETLAIDSLDWIEPLIWSGVCAADQVTNIEKVGGGYGKGYVEAQRYWQHMIAKLKELREKKGMNIIAIAHSHVKAFNDPSQPAPYDRYQLKLNDKAAALWREFVDFVGFANYEVYTKTDKDGRKSKAFGDGKRVLYTERRPSFDAKNRLGLPFEVALSFAEFHKHAQKGQPDSPEAIRADIRDLYGMLTDDKTKKSVGDAVKAAKDDVAHLTKLLNQLRVVTTK